MQKLNISKLIIVEGKYDKIRLSNVVDANIIAINGFSVYNDDKLKKTIKKLAKDNGAIILTDSDTAGYKLRVYVSKILSNEDVINIFTPQIEGKEKRKAKASAQGYIGVEGIDDQTIYSLLKQYSDINEVRNDITVSDLYDLGFVGVKGAKERKNGLLANLGIQQNISNKFLLRILNDNYTKKEFYSLFSY